MRKTFSDNYLDFEAELIDRRGKKTLIVIKSITASMLDKIHPLCMQHDDEKTMRGKTKVTWTIAGVISGRPGWFFRKYSYSLLWDFIKAFFDHVKKISGRAGKDLDPTAPAGN